MGNKGLMSKNHTVSLDSEGEERNKSRLVVSMKDLWNTNAKKIYNKQRERYDRVTKDYNCSIARNLSGILKFDIRLNFKINQMHRNICLRLIESIYFYFPLPRIYSW